MSDRLPLPSVDWEITISKSSVLISLKPGPLLSKFRQCSELGESLLAAAWVLTDVTTSLEEGLKQQIETGGHNG